ncbi:MAG: hypothetical protein JETT_3437 [Candidatus Jettenia ecosi]|uniref:Uncharacterized protein n=1 Tax=Candidatus Jettenia ecosi TaxID=2494326 RepID=A0A533Q6R7_9BACT|nr:MAG: hypothetical protein JETT_3437 [Candidatus Jettenia ecosi]
MDLLHQVGGLSRTDIGEMMRVDYSTVSLGRKRLREKLKGVCIFLRLLKEVRQICKR